MVSATWEMADVFRRILFLAILVLSASVAVTPAAALSNDGTVSIEYSGKYSQSFVYQPSNPAVWQGAMQFSFDEKATYELAGNAQGRPKATLVSRSLTLSGGESNTFAPPNSALTCRATYSARAGAPDPISVYYAGGGTVGTKAFLPDSGTYVQGSDSNPQSHCYVRPSEGGFGFTISDAKAIGGFAAAEQPEATLVLPSQPYSHTYVANGSDSQTTQSFTATLQVHTSGSKPTPPPVKLTPAEVQAKRNALAALKQTLPASLYPCVTLAAGTSLLAPTPLGLAVGGSMVAVSRKICLDYINTIEAELNTVKDPPRSDFGILAKLAAPKAAASTAVARLLAAERGTAAAAQAISTTIAREVGAQRAHHRAAAANQNRHLIALMHAFSSRRKTEIAAGKRLAAIARPAGPARLKSAEVAAAEAALLSKLGARGVSASHVKFAHTLFRRGPLNVLSTLGR